MKYRTSTVLLGSKIRDKLAVRAQNEKLTELLEMKEKALKSYSEDQPLIEQSAREILRKAENGEPITRDELETAFMRNQDEAGWRSLNNRLGLDRRSLDNIEKNIEAAEAQRQTMEKSRLTRFLEMVDEDRVSDYAIKGAGFKVRLADLFMLGLDEEERLADADEQSA